MDPIAHIRSHPEMYLTGGRFDPSDVAARIAGDALILGASRTLVVHRNDWWAVAADLDWLANAPVSVTDLFRRIVPFPKSGTNSMRSEVILAAFVEDVVTWRTAGVETIMGKAFPDIASLFKMVGRRSWARVIAFRYAAARVEGRSNEFVSAP